MSGGENFDPVTPGGIGAKLGAVAVATAVELLTQTPGAGAVTAVGVEAVTNIAGAHIQARQLRAAGSLQAGAEWTGATVDDLWAAIAEDPQRLELVGRALVAAGRATTAEKIRVLGRALFTGALADDQAIVDAEALFIDAMAVLDAPHVRALAMLATRGPGHSYGQVSATSAAASAWSPEQVRDAYPGRRLPRYRHVRIRHPGNPRKRRGDRRRRGWDPRLLAGLGRDRVRSPHPAAAGGGGRVSRPLRVIAAGLAAPGRENCV